MKHTPGPWTANSFPAYGYGITAADSPQARESFAVVHFADKSRGRTAERAKADAFLISAAPDLLDALNACAETLAVFVENGDAAPDSVISKNLKAARDAIKKATQ